MSNDLLGELERRARETLAAARVGPTTYSKALERFQDAASPALILRLVSVARAARIQAKEHPEDTIAMLTEALKALEDK